MNDFFYLFNRRLAPWASSIPEGTYFCLFRVFIHLFSIYRDLKQLEEPYTQLMLADINKVWSSAVHCSTMVKSQLKIQLENSLVFSLKSILHFEPFLEQAAASIIESKPSLWSLMFVCWSVSRSSGVIFKKGREVSLSTLPSEHFFNRIPCRLLVWKLWATPVWPPPSLLKTGN